MQVRRWRACALGLTTIGLAVAIAGWALAGAAGDESPPLALPGSEAQAALEQLAEPSAPTPLPGSESASSRAFRYPAGCEALRTAYLAADAPVPRGSVVSAAADGGLRFDTPFGPVGLFIRDELDGACAYEIWSAPTIVILGPDAPAIDGYFTLSCFEPFGVSFLAVAQVDIDGQPRTLTISQSATIGGSAQPEPFTLGWYPGLPADLFATNATPDGGQEFEGLAGTYDPLSGAGSVFGAGPTGPIDVRFQCTLGNFTIPGL